MKSNTLFREHMVHVERACGFATDRAVLERGRVQVHPDKHPEFSAETTAATARVNQAMDVRSRHVTEV
jgi:hypothetical protein